LHVQAYENIKKRCKKVKAADKVEAFRTGGGCAVKSGDSVDDKALALLGHRGEPLTNNFDSDASYQSKYINVGINFRTN